MAEFHLLENFLHAITSYTLLVPSPFYFVKWSDFRAKNRRLSEAKSAYLTRFDFVRISLSWFLVRYELISKFSFFCVVPL